MEREERYWEALRDEALDAEVREREEEEVNQKIRQSQAQEGEEKGR